MNQIGPLVFVYPEAQLGDDNVIGPFCYLDKNIALSNRSILQNSVTVNYGARISDGNEFLPGTNISTKPQDLKFVGEDTTCEIGDKNSTCENVTIPGGTASKETTRAESNNLLMENTHVTYDCIIGSNVVVGSSAKFAGRVTADDYTITSAIVLCHQFHYIGGYAMIQGGSRPSQDIPLYVMAGKEPIRCTGINIIGSRQKGLSNKLIQLMHQTYRLLYSKGVLREGTEEIRKNLNVTPEIQYIIDFVESSQRGIIGQTNISVVPLGPTRVGKTGVVLQIAEHLQLPIINVDSQQLFVGIPISAVAPTKKQQERVRHYLAGTLYLTGYYSAVKYEEDIS